MDWTPSRARRIAERRRLRRALLGVVLPPACVLWLLGGGAARAQSCAPPGCVTAGRLSVTSTETLVDEGGTVHYLVTWENTGTQVLGSVDLEAGWLFILDTFPNLRAPECASENQGWTLFEDSSNL